MTPLLFIRRDVFRASQAEMAAIVGVSQGTISKWEAGLHEPSRHELARIRAEAVKRRIKWKDAWFFAPPTAAASLPQVGTLSGAGS